MARALLARLVGFGSASVLIALVLLSGSSSARADVLTEFQSLCMPDLAKTDGFIKQALTKGWKVVKPEVEPQLEKIIAISTASRTKPLRRETLGKGIEGGMIYAIVSGVPFKGGEVNACYVYDFSATEKISTEKISDWLGAKPTTAIERMGVSLEKWKRPAKFPEYRQVVSQYADDSSIATKTTGLIGLTLTATADVK